MLDLDAIADVVADAVKAATDPLIAENKALCARLTAVEARKFPDAIKGDPGEVDMDAARSILSDLVDAAIADIPTPKDGKSVDIEVVRGMIEEAVSSLPPAKDGEDGVVDMEAVRSLVDEAALRIVGEKGLELAKLIPVPAAPEPIEPDMKAIASMVADGIERAVSALPAAKDGDNGIGLADALIDKDGHLVVTMTDGRTKALGKVVGKDGDNGKPGEAFTLDDFDIEQTDDRIVTFKFLRGDMMHTFELEFPVPIFREAFKEGRDYRKGDMVVWGGSLWSATRDTNAKPDTPDSGWMIAARKGRDGKSA